MQAQTTDAVRGTAIVASSSARQNPVEPAPAAEAVADAQHLQKIRAAAYALYEARGCVEGHELDDWLQAEQQARQPLAGSVQAAASATMAH
ncbi:MAG: DUF2934 domain-containing protein [Burkholderiales bacterium]|nr:DUF2934 domain-containing protein [Burkholderiales bacterium]